MSNNAIIEVEKETTVERPYTLRRLIDNDLWVLLDIIGKVFPDDLASSFGELVSGQKDFRDIGVAMFARLLKAVFQNLPTVNNEVYAFLSDVSGIPASEIPKMGFGTTPMMIWDIVHNEQNDSFFVVLFKSS